MLSDKIQYLNSQYNSKQMLYFKRGLKQSDLKLLKEFKATLFKFYTDIFNRVTNGRLFNLEVFVK